MQKRSTKTTNLLKRLQDSLILSILYCSLSIASWAETEIPFALPERGDLLKIRSAILETTEGKLFFELLPEEAPWHVANFKYLADKHFYDGLHFHYFQRGTSFRVAIPKTTASVALDTRYHRNLPKETTNVEHSVWRENPMPTTQNINS